MTYSEMTIRLIMVDLGPHVTEVGTLEDKLKVAMKGVQNHWITTDEDLLFRGAVGAVLVKVSDEDRRRLEAELDVLKALSALQSGIPVDLAQVLERNEGIEQIGLMNLWREVKDDSSQ